jgi:hypothetical protein
MGGAADGRTATDRGEISPELQEILDRLRGDADPNNDADFDEDERLNQAAKGESD